MAVIEYDEYKQKLLAMEETYKNLHKALGIDAAKARSCFALFSLVLKPPSESMERTRLRRLSLEFASSPKIAIWILTSYKVSLSF